MLRGRQSKKPQIAEVFTDELLKNFADTATIAQRFFSSSWDLTSVLIPNKKA